MEINEYGKRENPTIILLAPMMVTGAELAEMMMPHFKGSYHIVAPDLGGHGKSGRFISAAEEYRALKKWLLDRDFTNILLVYGASLGVTVGYRLFLDPAFYVHHAWFDGVSFAKNAAFTEWFMRRLFHSRKKKLAKTHVEASESLVKMYGYDFAKMMTKNFEKITEHDIDAICYACCNYDLKVLTEKQQERLHLDFGEKDFDLKISKKSIPVYMPRAVVTIRKGYGHCGYMAAQTAEYVQEIEAFCGMET